MKPTITGKQTCPQCLGLRIVQDTGNGTFEWCPTCDGRSEVEWVPDYVWSADQTPTVEVDYET